MHRRKTLAAAFSLAIFSAVAARSTAQDPAAEGRSTKEIMTALYKGPDSAVASLKNEMKQKPLKWKDVQEKTKEMLEMAEELNKNDPPRGDKAAFHKLTAAHLKSMKALDEAAKKKKTPTVKSTLTQLSNSCMGCHRTFRGPG